MDEGFRSFDMSISRKEFLRLLPRAVAGAVVDGATNNFVHAEAGRHWRITLTPLPELALGALQLERHRVEWRFSGYPEVEIEGLVRRLELHFHRGGG